ncbi:MAG: endonuclease/exonuclease/phosphatase family protein [Phycisphaerales bacterium]|jgi:endonuclease/exonuclease/phosphatase family metal-dependent hydrolase|nr:endonuclease/exonuclease/phosphatase family protein [Phycisphaerales bacterium]
MKSSWLGAGLVSVVLAWGARAQDGAGEISNVPAAGSVVLRVATFNVEDMRTSDLKTGDQPRLKQLAEVIQRMRPNIIFLNEIAYDGEGFPDLVSGEKLGQNAARFAELYLAVPQAPDVQGMKFKAFMAPVNTGVSSGFDLDNDGKTVAEFPMPPASDAAGNPSKQTAEGRAYGNDCWGFGTFPGQYGMALLVDERLEILSEHVRTFRLMPWSYLPNAMLPKSLDGKAWFDDEELKYMRLSSKSHWDVPVRLPNKSVLHVLCSHPSPPAFDGAEMRNARRNHDEVRFWSDYIDNSGALVDDASQPGGLWEGSMFVIVGDLNADPDEGASIDNPIGKLLGHAKVNASVTPIADVPALGLDPDDTSSFRMRVDYVLASRAIAVAKAGVWRRAPGSDARLGAEASVKFPSDHYPVWADLAVPPPVPVTSESGAGK